MLHLFTLLDLQAFRSILQLAPLICFLNRPYSSTVLQTHLFLAKAAIIEYSGLLREIFSCIRELKTQIVALGSTGTFFDRPAQNNFGVSACLLTRLSDFIAWHRLFVNIVRNDFQYLSGTICLKIYRPLGAVQ